MQEILKSTLLDFEKSFFYINFMKSSKEERYISIEQTMGGNYAKQKIKIRFSDLPQIIDVLQKYQKEMSDSDSEICKKYLSEDKQKMVVERYFKGISIDDLALQFDCTAQTISLVLSIKEIEIADEKTSNKENRIRLSRRKY